MVKFYLKFDEKKAKEEHYSIDRLNAYVREYFEKQPTVTQVAEYEWEDVTDDGLLHFFLFIEEMRGMNYRLMHIADEMKWVVDGVEEHLMEMEKLWQMKMRGETVVVPEKRSYYLNPELKEYALMVLERDDIPYEIDETTGRITVAMSAYEYGILLEDALCEEQKNRNPISSSVPVFSHRTLMTPLKLARLKKIFGNRCYRVLSRDSSNYEKEY